MVLVMGTQDTGVVSMPHQWLEGNLPVSAKCNVCDKTCGSVLRLQDWRCLWCKAMVHSGCKEQLSSKCPLGQCKVSVIPPTALNSIDSDGFWKASCPPSCTSPLLVFVNSKSGDNQGVKFLRRFKQLLNPAQVFDLMNGGPHLGLRLFQKFDTFRILVCGGDGSVGWVLSDIDTLTLHKQCQLGVLPLGTGNDLARVLGWGAACDDDTQLPQILEKLERASTKMLDRWSIMVYETKFPRQRSASSVTEDCSEDSEVQEILTYEDSVAAHLSKILTSDQHSVVISSAKVLCETVKDFVARVGKAYEKNTESSEESESMAKKCCVLKEKLDSLLQTLNQEAQASTLPAPPPTIAEEQEEAEGQLMLRANSLKKAIRQIIEHTERAVDEQNAQTQQHQQLFSPLGAEEDEGLPEEEEEEDKVSLQSSYSTKQRSTRRVTKTPCERLISKGGLSLGSSASLPLQTGSRENMPMLNTKILYPALRGFSASLSSSSVISRLLVNADPFSCDPDNILQGIAVLNIPSYAGGTNFWGGTKEDDTFTAPSFDDKILEVVAVFGSMQMAVSRVINLQHHRIAQCRMVKITILGDEGVPVQVDGEAWVQPPGYIKIIHKNRTQTLTRDRAFESTLKSWEDKQKCEFVRSPPPPPAASSQPEIVSEEETALVSELGQAAGALIHSIREVAQSHHSLEQELAHAVNASSKAMDVVYAKSNTSGALSCSLVLQMVSNVKALLSETELLLAGKMSMQLDPPQQEQLTAALSSVSQQLRRLADVPWLSPVIDEGPLTDFSKRSRSAKFRLVPKFKKDKNNKNKETCATLSLPVHQWGTEEVGAWLDFLCLSEYKDIFIGHDVRGAELIHLERRDLKDLGVTKVGHIKRILQGIREINRNSSASEA
ncbi:hypothetical protein PFLUV_G00016260 [Perca fluviatilis]|uniref:Diacylglycerol kinase n=1 Tax=Perca fluviatilis TaxID=8168 RepID=A0A6A5FGC0_PERFL|nr:hypothetical protein PFLUV_G00016260 [Perca fluviatilis]